MTLAVSASGTERRQCPPSRWQGRTASRTTRHRNMTNMFHSIEAAFKFAACCCRLMYYQQAPTAPAVFLSHNNFVTTTSIGPVTVKIGYLVYLVLNYRTAAIDNRRSELSDQLHCQVFLHRVLRTDVVLSRVVMNIANICWMLICVQTISIFYS